MEQLLKLAKPILIDGEEQSEIAYDLEELTGADIQAATKELSKRGIVVTVIETDQNYHAAIFAQASGLSYEDVARLNIKDYQNATLAVRDFFLQED